jgi:hypothetical protein
MRLKTLLGLSVLISLFSCNTTPDIKPVMREAWVPVYSSDPGAFKAITAGPARPTVESGKIFTLGNLLYQVEVDSGIHVINYSNPSSPQKLGFIRSFLCKEVSVKNGLIYTNNGSDLVVIEATSMSGVREVARTPGVFPDLALQYPPKPDPMREVWFECPDPEKGIVVSWEKRTIDNAKCRR